MQQQLCCSVLGSTAARIHNSYEDVQFVRRNAPEAKELQTSDRYVHETFKCSLHRGGRAIRFQTLCAEINRIQLHLAQRIRHCFGYFEEAVAASVASWKPNSRG